MQYYPTVFFPKNPADPNVQSMVTISAMEKIIAKSHTNIPSTNMEEITTAVFSMKKNKAPGADGITLEHIQCYFNILKETMHNIYQAYLSLAYFPKNWKLAKILVIPKPGLDDYESATSYRPISLLSVLGKFLRKLFLIAY